MSTDTTPSGTAEPVSARSHGARLDELAALEEERRFLLRSLQDLEREHEAGDVDDVDYRTLKDGYTVRAAAVLRQIDDGRRALPAKPPRRWGRLAIVVTAVAVVAVGIGFALAQAWGERGTGQEITGATPGDDVRVQLASARAAMNRFDFARANELFFSVVEAERERGVDNPEALTYYGWTLALGSRNNPDAESAERQIEVALIALDTAIGMDPEYADPYCFIAIVEANFRDDPAAAVPFLDECESRNPPADIKTLLAEFGEEIRADAG